MRAALKGCATDVRAALKGYAADVAKAAMLGCAVASMLVSVAQGFSPAPAAAQDAPRPAFSEWLAAVRTEALARGIKPEVVDAALADVEEPLPVVLERDRAQAETVFSLEHYVALALRCIPV